MYKDVNATAAKHTKDLICHQDKEKHYTTDATTAMQEH